MKKLCYLLLLVIPAMSLLSCSNSVSYADLKKQERQLAFKPRADEKASASAQELMKRSLSGYASLNPPMNTIHIDMTDGNINNVLFPVWVYKYTWGNKTYPFYINGQTGKVIGNTPVSKVKALIYSISLGGFLYIIFWTLRVIWEVL